MARTVIGSGLKFLPEVSDILILTGGGSGTLTPTLANITDAATLEVTAAVATISNFSTSRTMVSESEWGSQGLAFTLPGGRTLDGTPTIEFWADRGGDDMLAEIDEDDTVSIVIAPEGVVATDVVRIYSGSVASVTYLDEKGAPARVRAQFAIQSYDLSYTVPGA